MDIREDVKQCLEQLKGEWLAAKEDFPDFLEEISVEQKQLNEAYASKVSEEFRKQTRHLPRLPIGRKRWRKKTLDIIFRVLYQENIIGIHNSMQEAEIEAFYEELMAFLKHTRHFSPELRFDEIGQAIRNYIVYAMFKVIHQVQSGFSNAGFGYSMLYPFTDNYIDGSNPSPTEKQEYNQLIRDKILGLEVHPDCEHYKKTCDLLQAIASEYPREKDDRIYTLLLMMLEAQEESISQQSCSTTLNEEQRLNISLFKGGVSVLVDRFLVNKELTPADLHFYLGFGFFLQLADDLQDIKEDSEKGYQTLFTVELNREHEEKLVNKLLHFLHNIMGTYSAENDTFKNFVMESSNQLIYTSLCGSKEFFTSEYQKRIERLLPVSLSYLEGAKANSLERQDNRIQDNYIKVLDLLIR
ncbi:MAG: Uncharacterized protein K0R34_942 [Herbinix sp.]|jgi:hypothetical protein|nr:Uncharacterized protein [Herbinix sp.]